MCYAPFSEHSHSNARSLVQAQTRLRLIIENMLAAADTAETPVKNAECRIHNA